MRLIFWALAAFPCFLWAHQDPLGDIHPEVSAVGDRFEITFKRNPISESEAAQRQPGYSIAFSEDGKVIIPRHSIPTPLANKNPSHSPQVEFRLKDEDTKDDLLPAFITAAPAKKEAYRAVWVEHPYDNRRSEKPLALEIDAFSPQIVSFSQSQGKLAILWSDVQSVLTGTAALRLSLVDDSQNTHSQTKELGTSSASYSVAVASAPIWMGERWWIGWQSVGNTWNKESEAQMVLSSYHPQTDQIRHQPIEGSCYWISTLSLARSTGDWLCLAWHGPGSKPPYHSEIITHFEKPAPPH